MPKHSNHPEKVYSKSGKLYSKEQVEDSSSGEEETTTPVKTNKKNGSSKQTVKQSSRYHSESESEEEAVSRKASPAPSKKNHKKSTPIDSDDDLPELPPLKHKEPKKKVAAKKAETETKKKSSKKTSPVKKSKTSKKTPVVDSDSDNSSDDESLATPEKLRIARHEMLSEEQMKTNTREELEKKYRYCCTFKKWYEKVYLKEEDLPAWKQASKDLTNAAATLVKYQGLKNSEANIPPTSHLLKAIPKLKESGEKLYTQAMAAVAKLPEEDLVLFWKEQERNKNATCFEELVTMKEEEKQKLVAKAEANLIRRQKAEAEAAVAAVAEAEAEAEEDDNDDEEMNE